MSSHHKPYQVSPSNPDVQEIQTMPSRRVDMPYAPAMRVTGVCAKPWVRLGSILKAGTATRMNFRAASASASPSPAPLY